MFLEKMAILVIFLDKCLSSVHKMQRKILATYKYMTTSKRKLHYGNFYSEVELNDFIIKSEVCQPLFLSLCCHTMFDYDYFVNAYFWESRHNI